MFTSKISRIIVKTKNSDGVILADSKKSIIAILAKPILIDGQECSAVSFSKGLLLSMGEALDFNSQEALIALRGATVEFDATHHVAGEQYTNPKTREVGTYAKDGFSYSNINIDFNGESLSKFASTITGRRNSEAYAASLKIAPVAVVDKAASFMPPVDNDVEVDETVAPHVEEPLMENLNEAQ